MSLFPRGTRVTCALPNIKRIGTPGSRVRPRSPLRRDLESTGQGTHLSDLRTTEDPLPPGRYLGGFAPPERISSRHAPPTASLLGLDKIRVLWLQPQHAPRGR